MQELAGVETPAVLLSGTWQFQYSPDSKWDKIQVPGEPAMQGYAIEHDKPFTYRKSFTVPADYAGKHTILRFDGVYSHARLFVNGRYFLCLRLCPSSDRGNPARCNLVRITRNLLV